MKKGEIYQGIIENVDFPNKGIVQVEDKKVIVKNAMPGQKVRFMINKKKGSRLEGRLLEVLEKSPLETRNPMCSIFPDCGGCMYQTMSYESQLEMKAEQIKKLIDQAVKSGGQVDEQGNFAGVSGARRVTDIMVNGEPLDDNRMYTVASHNYWLKSGGDGMSMFAGCEILKDDTMVDVDTITSYIAEYLNGTVGEEYADPAGQGRITIR